MQGHNWMNHVKLLDPTVTIVMAKVETDGWQNPAPLWRCTETLKNYKAQKLCFGAPLVVQGFCPPTVLICVYLYTVYIYICICMYVQKNILLYIYIHMNIFIINSYHIWYRSDTQIIFRNMGDTDQNLLQVILSCLKNFSSRPTVCQFFANAYPVLWQPTRWTLKFDTTWNGKALSCPMIVLQAISLMLPRSKKVKCTN